MKYINTTDINIKKSADSGVFYYVRGQVQESLRTTDWKEAKTLKQLKETELRATGMVARTFKVGFLYEKYRREKELQRDGRLDKSICALCASDQNVHAHHRDYSRPLDVVWLCAKCHHRVHATFPELGGHFQAAE